MQHTESVIERFDSEFNKKLWPVHDCREDLEGNIINWIDATRNFITKELGKPICNHVWEELSNWTKECKFCHLCINKGLTKTPL